MKDTGVHGVHVGGRPHRPAHSHTLPAITNRSSPEGKSIGGGFGSHTVKQRLHRSHGDHPRQERASPDRRALDHRSMVPFRDGLDDDDMDFINKGQAADREILSSMRETEDDDIVTSHSEFLEWLAGYDNIQYQFSSTLVCAEMKFQELQQARGLPPLASSTTRGASACRIVDKPVAKINCIALGTQPSFILASPLSPLCRWCAIPPTSFLLCSGQPLYFAPPFDSHLSAEDYGTEGSQHADGGRMWGAAGPHVGVVHQGHGAIEDHFGSAVDFVQVSHALQCIHMLTMI